MTGLEWIGLVADTIGIAGAIFALFAWRQTRQIRKIQEQELARQNRRVRVILQHGGEKIELPMQLRRAELSRAEILGRIGMIPMKKKGARFSLAYTSKPEFLAQINQVLDGTADGTITIACTEDEFRQFDL